VHGASDAAQHLFVGGTSFEFEASLIESLENFRGAFKEQRAEFRPTILGEIVHVAASTR
jgi:hypothetical protein